MATITGNVVYLNAVGESTISAIQMGDTRYHLATVSQNLRVIDLFRRMTKRLILLKFP